MNQLSVLKQEEQILDSSFVMVPPNVLHVLMETLTHSPAVVAYCVRDKGPPTLHWETLSCELQGQVAGEQKLTRVTILSEACAK